MWSRKVGNIFLTPGLKVIAIGRSSRLELKAFYMKISVNSLVGGVALEDNRYTVCQNARD